MTRLTIQARIVELAARWHTRCVERQRLKHPTLPPPEVTVDFRKKYARIVYDHSAAAFVDLATGDILYPRSFYVPEKKNPRGSVLADDYGLSAFGDYMVNRLR